MEEKNKQAQEDDAVPGVRGPQLIEKSDDEKSDEPHKINPANWSRFGNGLHSRKL